MQINDVGMTRRHFQDGEIERVRMIVLHATAGRAPGDYHWLRQGGSSSAPVSIHYYIDKAGTISRMVADNDIAWHAGRSTWEVDGKQIPYNEGCNGISIGIELENLNDGRDPYPPEQYAATLWLVRHLAARYNVPRALLVRHLDIAPQRKTDPRAFPWERFVSEVYGAAEVPADVPAGAPADAPAAPVPEPLPPAEQLCRRLVDLAYRVAGSSCPEGWPLLRAAVSRETGMPVWALTPDEESAAEPEAQARAITLPGQAPLVLEAYGRDLFYAPPDDLEQVRRLGETPSGQLRDALLQALFRAADPAHGFRPDWAFHQFYLAYLDELGVPLGPSYRLPASGSNGNGRGYVCQHFALDSLCAPVGQWRQISRLSDLLPALDAPEPDERRDLALLLLNDLYRRRSGRHFDPAALFCRYALAHGLGAPLGKAEYLTLEGQKLVAMPFALDVISCRVPEDGAWETVTVNALPATLGNDTDEPPVVRLSDLLKQARPAAPAVLGAEEPALLALLPAPGALLGAEAEPPLLTDIVTTGETAPLRAAPQPSYIAMCGAPGPAAHDLARCPAWHYYIDRMGGVVRLLDEAYVARELVGRHWKGQPGLEQHALAVALEGSTTELTAAQQVALRRLLAELMPRYGLRREHLLRAVAAAPAPSVAPALDEHPAPSEATLQQAAVGGG